MDKQQQLVATQQGEMSVSTPLTAVASALATQKEMAQLYMQSTMVPKAFQGNIGNCVIAIDMAMRMQANPLMVMQNLYIVHGNPAWSSKFLIACINMSGRFTPLRFQFVGTRGTDKYACRAFAYERSDKDKKDCLTGTWITMDMANREGWTTKEGSKWRTMADQMLIYRAAAFWSRMYAPEISMGILTKEEIDDAVVVEEIPVVNDGNEPEPEVSEKPFAEEVADATAKVKDAIKKNQTLFSESEEVEPQES